MLMEPSKGLSRFIAGASIGATIYFCGAALSNYMQHVSRQLDELLGVYTSAARCVSAGEGMLPYCEELWERYNRLASGAQD